MAAAPQPVRLQPSSPWNVDYAANSCRLIRTFGEGETLVRVAFESDAPGSMDLVAIGKPLQTSEQQVFAKFLPVGGKPFEGTVAAAATNGDPAMFWSYVPMLPAEAAAKDEKSIERTRRYPGARPPAVSVGDLQTRSALRKQFAAAATAVEIDAGRNRSVILQTGPLGVAVAAFDKCSSDSLTDWGVDPDLDAKIVRRPWPLNASEWLSESDYPPAMLDHGTQSQLSVRLLIDASGKVTNCTSLSPFDAPEFNRISCASILKRARFEPAELADGTKVPSYFIKRVVFRIAQ